MTSYFDLSTSARWSGHAVGIVRVERELARRAALSADMGFCVYDRAERCFKQIDPKAVAPILAGEITVSFDLPAEELPAPPESWRFRAREAVLRHPRLYQAVQRVRGRRFSLSEIAEVRRYEAEARSAPKPKSTIVPLAEVVIGKVALDADTRIISGGLDWEYKDLRTIYELKKVHGFSYAAIVYDLIPQMMPQFVVPSYVNLLKDYFGELFWVADACMCISESTRRDMMRYCEQFGIPAPRSDAFPLGCDVVSAKPGSGEAEPPAELPPELEGKRYALFVSTIEPRKNHRTLYQAWTRAMDEGRLDPARDRLVFVGRSGWAVGDLIQEMDANPVAQETIVRLSNISDAELDLLYKHAALGLFPSFYEGYGLPLAEMLGHGKACLSSRSGSLEEVGGDLVEYIDPLDTLGWSDAIVRMFNDKTARTALERRVAKTHKPVTWDAAADLFFARLKDL
ncbi:glycosyltransferase family 4 protein [Caulobacter zeae]|uniref:glycosyltransferase family 4 protein n=1 Tax=Caulobacter zeae TaxID=2055137 RepID=UPI00105651DD|nr:glycosyltransferase family 1 protein [Caulobacter zeae]